MLSKMQQRKMERHNTYKKEYQKEMEHDYLYNFDDIVDECTIEGRIVG